MFRDALSSWIEKFFVFLIYSWIKFVLTPIVSSVIFRFYIRFLEKCVAKLLLLTISFLFSIVVLSKKFHLHLWFEEYCGHKYFLFGYNKEIAFHCNIKMEKCRNLIFYSSRAYLLELIVFLCTKPRSGERNTDIFGGNSQKEDNPNTCSVKLTFHILSKNEQIVLIRAHIFRIQFVISTFSRNGGHIHTNQSHRTRLPNHHSIRTGF